MRAVGLDYEAHRLLERNVPEPRLSEPSDVLFRVAEVGVCGTDRELAQFRLGAPPEGESFMVVGHEVLGEVIETGAQAGGIRPGNRVVALIRRACSPPCRCCARGRRDLCVTGRYSERGIFRAHGYFAEYALDAASNLTVVPDALAEVAVLAEPLSVVEKAIERATEIRGEPPENALVLGAGPIGLLAAMALVLRGIRVTVHSLEPPDHPRRRLAEEAGARYVESPDGLQKFDFALEATGSAEAAYRAIHALGPLGTCAILGGSTGTGHISFARLLVNNQTVFGSVNASPQAFGAAVRDLARADRKWLSRLIHRLGFGDFDTSILGPIPEVAKFVHVIH